MKKDVLLLLFFAFSLINCALGQDKKKDESTYTGGVIYQERQDSLHNTVVSKPLGKNVTIFYDAFFNKYSIWFYDQDGVRTNMKLIFVRNYFEYGFDSKAKTKIYLMQYQDRDFMVTDLLDHPTMGGSLIITMEDGLKDGTFLVFRIKDMVKDDK